MTARRRTILSLIVVGILLCAYDVQVAFFNSETGDTISEVVHDYGTRSWLLLVGIGVLLGHFWPIQALTLRIWRDALRRGEFDEDLRK